MLFTQDQQHFLLPNKSQQEDSLVDTLFAKECLALAGTDDEDFAHLCALVMKSCREGDVACLIPEEEERLHRAAEKLTPAVPIVREGSLFYMKRHWEAEKVVLDFLQRPRTSAPWTIDMTTLPPMNTKQREAVEAAARYPLLIISGGPGRGKTFVATQIAKQFRGSVIISAPTGKAASRYGAKTLHRLLSESPVICPDLLIIDECSMIDLQLWATLATAIAPHTRLVLIGDPHQLPPIETGQLFHDLCKADLLPHVHLEECLRSGNAHILQISEAVFREEKEKLLPYIHPLPSPQTLIHQCLEQFPLPSNTRPDPTILPRTVILSSLRKGPFGCTNLNEEIYHAYNAMGKLWIPIPILITKNAHSLELYNGDVGILLEHRYDSSQTLAYFGNKIFPPTTLPPFEKAWALSVHKSQGSEYDHVYFCLADGSESFGKEMLYTAITRAKKSITLFADKEVFLHCLTQKTSRLSALLNGITSQRVLY